MIGLVSGTTRRCFRRRAQFVIAVVASSSLIVVVILVIIQLHRLLTRWKLLRLAGDRHLLTFRSTQYWGIGNAMFAFASTLAIARSDRDDSAPLLCFDEHLQLRDAFPSLSDWPACSPTDVLQLLNAERRREDAYARYDSQLVSDLPRDRHVVLDRYLQSWKYFADIDAELRRLFRFDESALRAAADALTVTVGNDYHDVVKVGLHVRRGDIVEQESLKELGYVVADMSYMERAMDYMDRRLGVDNNTGMDGAGRRRLFVVCSNDMSWCLEHMPSHRLRHVVFVSAQDPIVDLAILAMCQHTIITVGTFGWWAAWLSNGTTVYFKDWPRQGSRLASVASHADYFLPRWIPL